MLALLISVVTASTAPSFYFVTGSIPAGCPSVQTFQDGQSYGPCNGGQGVKYSSASKYWAATYDAASHCGDTITMTYQGKSIQLVVMDQCPGCGDGHVDMGLDALIELTGSAEVACAINLPLAQVEWSYGGSAPSTPVVSSSAEASQPTLSSNPSSVVEQPVVDQSVTSSFATASPSAAAFVTGGDPAPTGYVDPAAAESTSVPVAAESTSAPAAAESTSAPVAPKQAAKEFASVPAEEPSASKSDSSSKSEPTNSEEPKFKHVESESNSPDLPYSAEPAPAPTTGSAPTDGANTGSNNVPTFGSNKVSAALTECLDAVVALISISVALAF
jgi:hypothetical protein